MSPRDGAGDSAGERADEEGRFSEREHRQRDRERDGEGRREVCQRAASLVVPAVGRRSGDIVLW
ncbi:hypothetical protein ACFQFH_06990 [Halobaculum halobium]|uniref:Uncharacterized protein n=1 Tax=Halobaculum halobium TaxID=3032281 RepID=A0ABD5T8F4_9EURY|nr:hypothetical protein [Halobaculum sp. SYNS20]